MPLELLLMVMRDEAVAMDDRIDCAKSAAPYVHPRLSAIDANIKAEVDTTTRIITELVRPPR